MAPETPCALISKGTTPDQRVVSGTLESIVEAVEAAGVRAPTIIIVGDVVNLRGQLGWLEQMPAEPEAFSPGDGGESGP